ncbi:MAG: hypothetical protein EB127_26730 [Alphaproteobacteria bacterium]|nr:hypothetical protein [Alphaproteobacteria bacterium]
MTQKKIDATDAPLEGAIEWFWKQLPDILPYTVDTETAIDLLDAYERAKQTQKHMVMHAYNYGFDDGVHMPPSSMSDDADEKFYNEFYGKQ